MTDSMLTEAVAAYTRRRDRTEHPTGEFDARGRWQPAEGERRPCCAAVRSPSAAYPYSLMLHCRTVAHVAALYGIGSTELGRAVRGAAPRAVKRLGGDDFYKLVARLPDGRLVSIYDGETEYRIGVTLVQRARVAHKGGYYVHASRAEAEDTAVRGTDATRAAPRVVIRVRAEGSYVRYPNGKIAFSRVTPLEVPE